MNPWTRFRRSVTSCGASLSLLIVLAFVIIMLALSLYGVGFMIFTWSWPSVYVARLGVVMAGLITFAVGWAVLTEQVSKWYRRQESKWNDRQRLPNGRTHEQDSEARS